MRMSTGKSASRFVAYINGKRRPANGYVTVRGNKLTDIAMGLDPAATTTVAVLKASSSSYDEDERVAASPVTLQEVVVDAGSKLAPTPAKPRRLEVIGDSDVSGYGKLEVCLNMYMRLHTCQYTLEVIYIHT